MDLVNATPDEMDQALREAAPSSAWTDKGSNGVTIGVDIGQKVDFTAICVAEHETRTSITETLISSAPPGGGPLTPTAFRDTHSTDHFMVRHLERLALGTSYPEVVRRVAALEASVFERAHAWPRIYIDSTGVGQPVAELLDRACHGKVTGCYFVHGDLRRESEPSGYGLSGGGVRLGKAWMVGRLQVLLQNHSLHLPNTDEARALADELAVYEIRIDQDGNDKYGAFKTGSHDDLVTALGLAVQETPSVGIWF